MSRLKLTRAALKAAGIELRHGDADQIILQLEQDSANNSFHQVYRNCQGEYGLEDLRDMVADLKKIELAIDDGRLPLDQCEPE